MVRLLEYEGKQLLREVGILVPEGKVATAPKEEIKMAGRIGKSVAIRAHLWRLADSRLVTYDSYWS